jgi:hypothetical protein
MIDPDVLLGQLVTALRANADLVALLNGQASAITAYSATYPTKVDLYAAIRDLNPPSILVAWTGTEIGQRSNGIAHQFAAYLAPRGKVAPMFLALREGTISPSGDKFKRYQLDPMVHFVDVLGCYSRQMIIGEAVFEYYEVPMRITERGVDS